MQSNASWRPIEPEEAPEEERPPTARPEAEHGGRDGLLAVVGAIGGAAVLAAAGLILWAGTPQPEVVLGPAAESGSRSDAPTASGQPANLLGQVDAHMLVDVQGAVVRPGLHRLPAGSRVGDAVAAAGGYGAQIDIRAAAEQLNLAQPLQDGAKIYVPLRGDPTPQPSVSGGTSASGNGAPGGLIEINSASQAQLETLPGIGPVTAAKIIAAREEVPFATVDELLGRKVVGPATFEKIRTLISVAP